MAIRFPNMSHKHGMRATAEYRAYAAAKSRCTNPKVKNFKHYGGRGIQFNFTSFMDFYSHIGPRPSTKHSLDRIENNGHYEIGNVRWATDDEQVRNRRPIKLSETDIAKLIELRRLGWPVARVASMFKVSSASVSVYTTQLTRPTAERSCVICNKLFIPSKYVPKAETCSRKCADKRTKLLRKNNRTKGGHPCLDSGLMKRLAIPVSSRR